MIDPKEYGKGAKKSKFRLKHLFRARLDTHLKFHPEFKSTPVDVKALADLFPVKNQGKSSSCGGQAWSSYLQVLKYIRDNEVVELSAHDIYSQCYEPNGGSDDTGLLRVVENYGIDTESDVPSYQNGQPPSEAFMQSILPKNEDVSMQQIVFQPLWFNGNDIRQVKLAIDSGIGAVCALLGNNPCWLTANGVVEVPALDQLIWGHWIHLISYNDQTQLITIKNSWGNKAGDKGYYYIPYGYFTGGRVYGESVLHLEPKGYTMGVYEKIINLMQNIISILIKK